MSQTSRTIQKFQADAEAWKAHYAQRDRQIAQQECDAVRMVSHSRDLLERTKSVKERNSPGQNSN
jgi:hypothetical protein